MIAPDDDIYAINTPPAVERVNCYAAAIGIDALTVMAVNGDMDAAYNAWPKSEWDIAFMGRNRLTAGILGEATSIIGAFEDIKAKHRLYGLVIPLEDELALAHMSDGLRPLAEGEVPAAHERRVSMVAGSAGVQGSPHYYFEYKGQLMQKPGYEPLAVAPAATVQECLAIDSYYTKLIGHFAVDPEQSKRAYDPRNWVPLVPDACKPQVAAILDKIPLGMQRLAEEFKLEGEAAADLAKDMDELHDVLNRFRTRHNIPLPDGVAPGHRSQHATAAATPTGPAPSDG